MSNIKLTSLTKGGGCGCKIPPAALAQILGDHYTGSDDGLVVGNSTGDDCAVVAIGDGQLLVSTTDFFTPIVDDPFDFGRIAAANSISDIYSMGARPIVALSVLAWPLEQLGPEVASEVIRGARTVCAQAGIVIGGGHSIENPEPVFGLVVNGIINNNCLKRNNTPRPGDLIFLTKPIGTGILSSALKRGLLEVPGEKVLVEQMAELNSIGERLGELNSVHAMTDVTGFGLIGHLTEMCDNGRLTAMINYAQVPLMPEVKKFAAQMIYADNTMRNWKAYGDQVEGITGESLLTLCDPQTNGGLLIAVDPSEKIRFLELFSGRKQFVAEIGEFREAEEKRIIIK